MIHGRDKNGKRGEPKLRVENFKKLKEVKKDEKNHYLPGEVRSSKSKEGVALKDRVKKTPTYPESKDRHGEKPARASQEVKPAQVIPLDGEDFKEF